MEKEEQQDPITLRINELITKLNMNKAQFAAHIGVSQPIISHITSGRNKPGLEVIQRILSGFDTISADWLIAGKGNMFRSGSDKQKEVLLQTVEALEQKIASSALELKAAARQLETVKNQLSQL
jgi:transcriptional regulator with XRE-family HTH domain